ncbi:MAG: DUF4292 domain-containing protein [Chitinophagaceae bacterium]|nr:DUF4292 domain-containing protein [Chitinophagaceae bacterium]
MRWIFLLFVAIAIAAMSCRSTKTIQTAISKKDSVKTKVDSSSRRDSINFIQQTYAGVMRNNIDFNTFSAKIKVDFEGADGKKNDFIAMLRLQKDSVLWVSINALLGIEAFRILITPDSVKVLNKLDKVVQLRSMNYLQDITKIPFTFKELQDLVMGNPIYFDSTIDSYRKEGDIVSLLNTGTLFKHLLTISTTDYLVQHSKLDDINPVRGRTANVVYGDYETKNGRSFSTFRKITVSEKSKLDIEMKYKQYDFNIPLNFPFGIPKNYKLQ